MTRKDYILIAEALKQARSTFNTRTCECERCQQSDADARALADVLARDNPCFDRERFLKACGVLTDASAYGVQS